MTKIKNIILSTILLVSSTSCKQSKVSLEKDLKDHIKEIWDIKLNTNLSLVYYRKWKPSFFALTSDRCCEYIVYDCLRKILDLVFNNEKSIDFERLLNDKTSFILKDEKVEKKKPKVIYQDKDFISNHKVDRFEALEDNYSWFFLNFDRSSHNTSYSRSGIRIYDPTVRAQGLDDYFFMCYVEKTSLLYISSIY